LTGILSVLSANLRKMLGIGHIQRNLSVKKDDIRNLDMSTCTDIEDVDPNKGEGGTE